MTDPNATQRRIHADQIRRALGEALSAVSSALNVAAAAVGVLACVVWARSDVAGDPNFPGRHLFAVLPLLFAAGTLKVYAHIMESESS